MLVRNNQACMHYCGAVPFKPGVNDISVAQAEYLLTDASFKARCEVRVLEVLDVSAAPVTKLSAPEVAKKVVEVGLGGMKTAAAIKVIKGTLDRVTLLKMREGETREPVIAEIEKQLAVLNTSDEKPKED
jgi:hypothetical protein